MEYSCSGIYKSSHLQVFFKIGVFKNVTIFTEKHLCWSLFNKVAGVKAYNFIKKRLRHRCFPVNTAKIFKNSFFYRTPLIAASGFLTKLAKNNCEENHFSVEFFSEIFYFLTLAPAFLIITPLQVFYSFCLSLNMSETYIEPSQTLRWSLMQK